MITVFLTLLALGGGSVGTYFLMDAPRRRAVEQLARLRRERADLADGWEEVNEKGRRAANLARQLSSEAADLDRRAAELEAGEAGLRRRVISHDELAAENAVLRAELRTAVVHAAYLDHQQHTTRAVEVALSGQRDMLGRAYFDEVLRTAMRGITTTNHPASRQRVIAAAERVRATGVDLPTADEERALTDLLTQYQREVQKQLAREEQAGVQKQMREDARRQREAEEAIALAEREKAIVAAALERALAAAAGTHATEVELLRAQLAEAEAKSERAKSNAEKGIRTGHVYVISNIGSFGEDVYKIGMTRRGEPAERVDELGDASVPFPFDVHMMIKCEDAPRLEKSLHHAFHTRRVNRVNLRKEFFRVGLDEIAAAVRVHHGEATVEVMARAEQYRDSLKTSDADLERLEAAFEGAVAANPSAASMED